ncbi:MAG: GLPGLI family protein [Saprospiraceae bacterium]
MKKLIAALLISLPFYIIAQTQGVIQYEETISFQIDLPEGMEEFKSQIPNSQKNKMDLIFTEEIVLYQPSKNDEAPQDVTMGSEEGGMMIKMKFDMPENKTFTNITEGTMIEKQDFMGKKFLIKGDVEKYKWKLTGEQEKILDYVCQKATYQDSTRNLVAWFTPQIPVATGPGSISGLPGMVLKLDRNDGEMVIIATSVELKEIGKNEIKAPKKGKKVTKDEFQKIQEEKMKEMSEEFGEGSGTRIIIRN